MNVLIHNITTRRIGRILISGIVLAAANWAMPATAGSSISFNHVVQSTLGDGINESYDGTTGQIYEEYTFQTTVANQGYVISAVSAQFPVSSFILYIEDLSQSPVARSPQVILLQSASVYARGQALMYGGTLAQPGKYTIRIQSTSTEQGSYTLNLGAL